MNRIRIGVDESNSKAQFKANPKLQRTQVSGNDAGIEWGNYIPKFPVIQNGIVTLKNRAVPLNLKNAPKTVRSVKFDKPSLQGVPKDRS